MPHASQSPGPSLRLERDGAVARLTIDRPARRNALTGAMWEELAEIVTGIGNGPDRALVLTGAGADFSAGADIGEFETLRKDADTARAYEAANSAAFAAVRNCAVPTVASIRGLCFGGGFGLASACDLRIGSRTALFSVPAAKLGLAYPQDAMQDIVSACGVQMARLLTYSASRIDAERAFQAGFLAELVDDGELDSHVTALAAAIAANAPLSIRASKAAIRAVETGRPDDIELAVACGAATFASSDYAEGRAAFRERRAPVFRGR